MAAELRQKHLNKSHRKTCSDFRLNGRRAAEANQPEVRLKLALSVRPDSFTSRAQEKLAVLTANADVLPVRSIAG